MKVPEYSGHPLSLLARITKPEADIPLYIWSPVNEMLIETPEAIDFLVASGYAQIPPDTYVAHLFTQLYELAQTATEDRTHLQMWARPADVKKVMPVTLAFSTEQLTENVDHVALLQFLPFPTIGEYGLLDDGTEKPVFYNIAQLPGAAQERWKALQAAILALATPGSWYPHNPQIHPHCSQELYYQRLITEYRASLLKGQKEVREQAKSHIARYEEAHQQVEALRQSWLKPDWCLQWETIRKTAQELAGDYYAYHCKLIKAGEKPTPDIANAFNMGVAAVFTHQPFQAYPAATIARTDEWQQETGAKENELILSYRRAKPSGTTFVQLREEIQDEQAREATLARMWEQTERLSDLDADVYLAMVAQMCLGTKDENGYTWIRADRILDYRGLAPKKNQGDLDDKYTGGHRWEKIEEIGACIKRMENVYIKVHEQEIIDPQNTAKRRRGSKKTISRESRLFVFGDVIRHNTLPFDGSPGKSIPIAWGYRESSWMVPFMEAPNRFVGLIFQKVLNYDPYHQLWEKRLSRHLMFWLRTNASHEKKPDLIIGNLLRELNLDIDEDRPQRTRDRFEKAMDRIQEDGVLTWDYEKDIELPARKWLPTWLAQKITVDDPPMIKSQYMSIAANAKVVRQARITRPVKGKKPAIKG